MKRVYCGPESKERTYKDQYGWEYTIFADTHGCSVSGGDSYWEQKVEQGVEANFEAAKNHIIANGFTITPAARSMLTQWDEEIADDGAPIMRNFRQLMLLLNTNINKFAALIEGYMLAHESFSKPEFIAWLNEECKLK